MTEASRVQKLLTEQNAEIDRLKARIEKLEAANLKQSCIIIDDQTRIEKLEAANLKQSCIKAEDMARITRLEAALDLAAGRLDELGYNDFASQAYDALSGRKPAP